MIISTQPGFMFMSHGIDTIIGNYWLEMLWPSGTANYGKREWTTPVSGMTEWLFVVISLWCIFVCNKLRVMTTIRVKFESGNQVL